MVKSVRQSNIELLRIIAMIFIVVGHVVLHGTHNQFPGSDIIKSITITGVNLFVMISGYFSIRLSFKSFLNIVGTVIFYNFLSIILCVLIFNQLFPIAKIIGAFFPMSLSGSYWFVSCYLMLMVLSPAINIVLENASNLQYMGILAVVAYISCVSGWIFRNPINDFGYSTFNMSFIYLIGHGIRRFRLKDRMKPYFWISLYIVCTVCIFLMHYISDSRVFNYNNPLIIVSAVSLFCYIQNLEFRSRSINWIAACMFPVYLIQDGYFGQRIYSLLYDKGVEYSFGGGYYAIIAGYFIILFLTAIIVERLRMKIMNKPIIAFSDKADRFVEFLKK